MFHAELARRSPCARITCGLKVYYQIGTSHWLDEMGSHLCSVRCDGEVLQHEGERTAEAIAKYEAAIERQRFSRERSWLPD
jgi:hypothetical protein